MQILNLIVEVTCSPAENFVSIHCTVTYDCNAKITKVTTKILIKSNSLDNCKILCAQYSEFMKIALAFFTFR